MMEVVDESLRELYDRHVLEKNVYQALSVTDEILFLSLTKISNSFSPSVHRGRGASYSTSDLSANLRTIHGSVTIV